MTVIREAKELIANQAILYENWEKSRTRKDTTGLICILLPIFYKIALLKMAEYLKSSKISNYLENKKEQVVSIMKIWGR